MQLALDDSIKLIISLLSILNPIGAIPIFLSLTESFPPDKVKSIATLCSLTVSITLILSFLLGEKLLGFFNIGLPAFTIGGGVLMFAMAMDMISGKHSSSKLNKREADLAGTHDIGVVPLAIPLISGPGSISTTVIYSQKAITTYHWIFSLSSLFFIGLLVKLILTYSRGIRDKMGTIGLNIMTRIMGLIILSVSIEMVAGGLRELFPVLEKGVGL